MSLRQTPITYLAPEVYSLSTTVFETIVPYPYVNLSTFYEFSSINQLSFLPGYFSSVWSELYFGSTIYVSTLQSPYALIVGPDNTVGGIYTLTAGISNSNYGSNALVGGSNSYGINANVLAYGTGVQAIGSGAAAFGIGTQATMPNSIAYGLSTQTIIGSNQHTHGVSNVADGTASHAEGISTFVFTNFSHTEGFDTQIWGTGLNSHAEGRDTLISTGSGALHVEGLTTFAYGGPASHAQGANTVADIGVAHAEGQSTISLASSSHTQGFLTIASTFVSSVFGNLSNVAALNAHVEGASNLVFMPLNHMEGLSSINFGWHSHIEGLVNSNQGIIHYFEGSNNFLQGPLIYNNSTFIKCFSSLLALRTYDCCIPGPLDNTSYQYSVFNHIEGANLFISSPTFICHIEGNSNRICATQTHVEGARNFAFFNQDRRTFNIAIGEGSHLEGFCNALSSPTWNIHVEGASNRFNTTDNIRDTNATHLGGCGHNVGTTSALAQTRGIHTEGSNLLTVGVAPQVFAATSIHKEGVNNGARAFPLTSCDQLSVHGEGNSGTRAGIVAGFSNGGFNGGQCAIFGKYNELLQGVGNTTLIGVSNYVVDFGTQCGTSLGGYTSNALTGSYMYGSAAFFHSTVNSRLIRGSAQTMDINLRAITSSSAYTYSNFLYTGNATYNNTTITLSSINYNTVTNGVNYPGSNQVVYMHNVDMKLTGYQTRRADSSGGLGFYSGTYSFAVYRDNTISSNLYLYDMSSQSSISTNVVSLTPISTIVKPLTESNRLFNTTEVNILLFARNTVVTVPQTALYGLQINTNGNIVTNWQAELEISQVMRP